MRKIAVILPGIGYHRDKPLLYYSAKLAQAEGYTLLYISYQDMPQKIRGSAGMMRRAAELACQQTAEQLRDAGLSCNDDILLIGKSIGTIAAAQYAAAQALPARQIRYTPLQAAFSYPVSPAGSCIAFLGEADPWSDTGLLRQEAEMQHIPLYLYQGCNHSLECDDILRNIDNLCEVMQLTADFIRADKK